MPLENSTYDAELLGIIKGYLSVLSSQVGDHPLNNTYELNIYELEETNLITSYRRKMIDRKEEVLGQVKGDDLLDNNQTCLASKLAKENNAIAWLENFLIKKFSDKVKCGRYLVGHILDLILFIKGSTDLSYLYHCNVEDKYHKGTAIFIPFKDKSFIVCTFKERIVRFYP